MHWLNGESYKSGSTNRPHGFVSEIMTLKTEPAPLNVYHDEERERANKIIILYLYIFFQWTLLNLSHFLVFTLHPFH